MNGYTKNKPFNLVTISRKFSIWRPYNPLFNGRDLGGMQTISKEETFWNPLLPAYFWLWKSIRLKLVVLTPKTLPQKPVQTISKEETLRNPLLPAYFWLWKLIRLKLVVLIPKSPKTLPQKPVQTHRGNAYNGHWWGLDRIAIWLQKQGHVTTSQFSIPRRN